jgi:hypothetical protein
LTLTAVLPTLPLQNAIWQHRQLSVGSQLYISQRTLRARTPIEPAALVAAWRRLVLAHDALRSRLIEIEGRVVQVVVDDVIEEVCEVLDARDLSEARRRAIFADLRARHLDRLAAEEAPPVAVGLVNSGDTSHVVLTWKHEILDGTGVRRIVRDLQASYRAEGLATTTLAAPMELLLARPPVDLGVGVLGRPPRQLANFASASTAGSVIQSQPVDWARVTARARTNHTTPTVLAVAAWLETLGAYTGSPAFLLTAEDFRPIEARDTPGMFTGVGAAWFPEAVVTASDGLALLHRHRRFVAGRRPVAVTELLRPAWEAGSLGLPDVLLTVHTSVDNVADPWQEIDASERTEFALNIDLIAGQSARMVVHADPARVDMPVVSTLLDDAVRRLQHPQSEVPRPKYTAATAAQHSVSEQAISLALAVCRGVIVGLNVDADTDVVTSGADSLTLMRLAVALTEAGLAVSVNDVFTARTPRGIAGVSSTSPAATVTSVDSSPVERSLLGRTQRHYLGFSPMHEQSIIIVARVLDAALFRLSLEHVANECGTLVERWRPAVSLRRETAASIQFTDVTVSRDDELMSRAHSILAADLDRSFAPGDLLFRSWLIRGPSHSAMAMAWHNAVLDGWSHATLIRFLQDTYEAAAAARTLPRRPGADISLFRAWCAEQRGEQASAYWHELLSDAAWPERSPEHGRQERRLSQVHEVCSARELASVTPAGITPWTVAVAVAAHSLRVATGIDAKEPIGVRVGLRPAELRGSLRMIGQATLEAPAVLRAVDAVGDLRAIDAQIRGAREHGHLGEMGIRSATRCPDECDLFQLLVVPEAELADDEWAVRGGSATAWREVEVWRREVSPAIHTVYVHAQADAVSFRVSSVADQAHSEAVARIVVAEARRQLSRRITR